MSKIKEMEQWHQQLIESCLQKDSIYRNQPISVFSMLTRYDKQKPEF